MSNKVVKPACYWLGLLSKERSKEAITYWDYARAYDKDFVDEFDSLEAVILYAKGHVRSLQAYAYWSDLYKALYVGGVVYEFCLPISTRKHVIHRHKFSTPSFNRP